MVNCSRCLSTVLLDNLQHASKIRIKFVGLYVYVHIVVLSFVFDTEPLVKRQAESFLFEDCGLAASTIFYERIDRAKLLSFLSCKCFVFLSVVLRLSFGEVPMKSL